MHSFPILYVEDEPTDIMFLKEAFEQSSVFNPMTTAEDGQQAVDYLTTTVEHGDAPPGLVLLDLKLPRKSGLEVLEWIRKHPTLHRVQVVILTSSDIVSDIAAAYSKGANGYLVKPPTFDKLLSMVTALRDYWLIHNSPPPRVEEADGSSRPAA